jgi:hypothetical protein
MLKKGRWRVNITKRERRVRSLFLSLGFLGLILLCGCDPETWYLKENETQLQGSGIFITPDQPDDGSSNLTTPDDPPDPEDDAPMNVGVDDAPEDPDA